MIELARHMRPVAAALLGEPNRHLSNGKELRYGSHGSLSVDLEAGTWFDHERGEGGGVLDLVQRQLRSNRSGALAWLRDQGVLDDAPAQEDRPARTRARVVARYVYTDADSRPLFRVLRWQPKRFSQERYEAGGWVGGKGAMDGVERVLYRLPEVLAAEEVVLVEGEKDADRLRRLDLIATTSPQGAGKWQPGYAEALAGKRVVIVPDNDKAGRGHAEAIAGSLAGKAAGVKVLQLEGLPPKGDVSDWLDAGHTADELRRLIARTPAWEPSGPPIIRIVPGQLDRTVEAAAAALGTATHRQPLAGHYRRGSTLVRAVRLAETAGPRRSPVHRGKGALVIAEADVHGLRVALAAAARWQRFDVRRDEWVPADVPKDVALALIATAPDWSAIPVLAGVVEAPTLRPDGTVLDRPGYDPDTGLLFDPGGTDFPPVPERPTREQAEAALAKLREVVAGFPFVDGASESVGLSTIVTPSVRKACRAVPLHTITAPKMASGKTLLASVAGYVRSGRAPTMMPQAQDPGEERKRLLGVLMDGDEIVVVDNVEREMQSDALCTVLTETGFTDRQLGGNRKVTAPSAATFIVTGNNVAIVGDLSSRTVGCALDPGCERPEEREFDVNLHETVPPRRAELAVAVLTVVRAYLAHRDAGGERVRLPNFARFEDWSRLVREPLVWLGMTDPCEGRERVEGRDPVRAQLGVLLDAWRENYPGEAATVAEAIRLATRATAPGEPEADIAARRRLHEALLEVGGEGNRLSSRSIGKFIAKHEGRIEGGLRFVSGGMHAGITRWQASAPKGLGGFGGFGGANARDFAASTDRNAANGEKRRETNPPNPPNPPDDVDRWFRGDVQP